MRPLGTPWSYHNNHTIPWGKLQLGVSHSRSPRLQAPNPYRLCKSSSHLIYYFHSHSTRVAAAYSLPCSLPFSRTPAPLDHLFNTKHWRQTIAIGLQSILGVLADTRSQNFARTTWIRFIYQDKRSLLGGQIISKDPLHGGVRGS